MHKQEYQGCMTKNLQKLQKGISTDERKLSFCSFAKLCSGKAPTMEEAMKICREPKAPKAQKAPKGQGRTKKMYFDPDAGPPTIPDNYEIAH